MPVNQSELHSVMAWSDRQLRALVRNSAYALHEVDGRHFQVHVKIPDDLSSRLTGAGDKCRPTAEIHRMMDDADSFAPIQFRYLVDYTAGIVRAAIVHQNNFKRQRQHFQR